jgi:hypothetical protein
MSGEKNWREDVDAETYFGHQQKQVTLADRRPVIRTASDLVGPGIDSNTVRITDFNDLLATFNGYFSSEPGANAAPNATDSFVGVVISDAEMGGRQEFTGLTSGIEYSRTFKRSPVDPEALAWTPWTERRRIPATYDLQGERDITVLHNTATQLRLPWGSSIVGDQSVYEWTDGALNIRKQGIYTGMVQVGDRMGSTVSTVAFYRPQGSSTSPSVHNVAPLAQTFYIPFTVIATDAAQAIYVTVYQSSGGSRDIWYRMSISRIGDAV